MSLRYGSIAFTDGVRAVQSEHGSQGFYGRKLAAGRASTGPDPLTEDEKDFLRERDGFYLASVGESGWPYVQFRGGPPGFVHAPDDHTIAWADFRGNLQYISTGNMSGDNRIALIAVDYAHRRRLKIFGRARIVTAEQDGQLVDSLSDSAYDAVVERAVVVGVEAYDWNCPQHITPRFTLDELERAIAPLRSQLAAVQAENAQLREQLDRAGGR